jgi:hypothetical protein
MNPSLRRLTGLAAVAALAALMSANAAEPVSAGNPPAAKSIAWKTDFNKALTQAKKQNKLLMVDFYTEG